MMNFRSNAFISLALFVLIAGCTGSSAPVVELESFPISSLDGVVSRSDVSFDRVITSDGNGSLAITTDHPVTVRLFELRGVDVEDARLIYKAKLRCEDLEGQVYLEMMCHFEGMGEFFSRGLHSPISGTTEWTTEETPFFLRKGQKPDYIKLNLVIEGTGSAWIDDVQLLKAPLG